MKRSILFLEQQSWLSGGQRMLETVLNTLVEEYDPVVAFPGDGPFRRTLAERNIETLTVPLGFYQTGPKSRSEMLEFAGRSLLCALKLAPVIRRRDIGLVYINGPRCLAAGVLAARLTGRPSLFHLHLTLTRWPEIFLVARLAHYVSAIVACSQAAAASVVNADQRLAGKTQVLYNPVAERVSVVSGLPEPQRSQSNPHAFTLGVVGRITKPKGQRVFLNALGRLGPQLKKQIRVIFIGAPSPDDREDLTYKQRLEECVGQFNLQTRVEWVGYQKSVGPFYRAMDVLVHPSLSQSGEAMPLAVLEALQHGVPIIASWTGGIPEVVRHGANGLLVPPGDEVALARALERFLQDAALRARLRTGAQSNLDDRFSLENFNSKVHEQIWKLCSTHNAKKPKVIREQSAA
jgi:glycosyltransferase involved in cell wall biosynthesis